MQLKNGIIFSMNSKNRKTLEAIFADPVRPGIKWADIEALFIACGGVLEEARGSRVCVEVNGVVAHFHRPHPQPDTNKGAVGSVRRFLENAGVTP
ncbi:MAG: type II toxin-antitoxin system HicA family toxin [Desulfovibrio sp.]|nr:type II toxin-antitoxin system HicA family toxin [Desulfovibrio sp.]